MLNLQSKITSQGQISVPAHVRKTLGLISGSALEWIETEGSFTVKRAKKRSSLEIHKAIFGNKPPQQYSLDELKAGVGEAIKQKYARG